MTKPSSLQFLIAWNECLERAAGAAFFRLWRRPGRVCGPGPWVVDVEFAKPYRITTSADVWVTCLSGTAWLTVEGCPTDTILARGDVKRVSRTGKPLIVGMPSCRLRIVTQREPL